MTTGLKNSPGFVFWLKKLKNDIEIALKPTALSYRKILSKFTMCYIFVKNKMWHYSSVNFFLTAIF